MKKLLCLLLIFAFLAAVIPTPARAEGSGEENGVYDPFAPENLDQGAAPEERHTYDDPAVSMMRSYSLGTSSDPRYVNVLLSQNNHTAATVCFTGNYALCDATDTPLFRVESDYTYTIAVNGTNLELRAADGAVLYSGEGFYFKEYTPPIGLNYNYFKVAQVANVSPASDRIYKGELNCYYKAKSGSYDGLWTGIYLVNCIYIEEYLKGVLPAEIGSGRPTAALQAQAIVARNYAVRSERTDGRIFDVYDYNLSQAYYGLYCFADTDAAVNATAGQVLAYDGTAIRAYYCNTNGGYTEISTNEWTGEGQSGPESVRSDPYDLLATAYVEEVVIPANPSSSNAYVTSLITNALVPALQTAYPGVTADQVAVTSLSISQGACYDAGCRHHDGTDQTQVCTHFCSVDVTFSGIAVTINTLSQSVDPVTVNVKDTDLYVSGSYGFFSQTRLSHYWLIENKDGDGATVSYTIRHARHGGGVGLSQQGAIQRANAGHTVTQILDFYFTGCAVEVYSALGAADALTDISAVSFSSSYEALGHDAYVYKAMDEESFILGIQRAESCVKIEAQNSDKTWAKINFNGAFGYIKTEAFTRQLTKIKVTNINQYYEVYSQPSAGTKLGNAYPNEMFSLAVYNAAPNYHKIDFHGQPGYISSRYSTLLTPMNAGDESGIQTYAIEVERPSGYTDTTLWVDGVQYAGTLVNGMLTTHIYSPSATNIIMYQYSGDVPIGMTVWFLNYDSNAYTTSLQSGLTNLLTYNGFSIRITGECGMRYWNGISAATKNQLINMGINGYKLVEYGTVVYTRPSWYNYYPFVKDTESTSTRKSYWEENGATHDLIYSISGDMINFTVVLYGFSNEQLSVNYPFRGYMILSNGVKTITIYGPQMARSIYYVAKAYMNIYAVGSNEYNYVKAIVDIVEGG